MALLGHNELINHSILHTSKHQCTIWHSVISADGLPDKAPVTDHKPRERRSVKALISLFHYGLMLDSVEHSPSSLEPPCQAHGYPRGTTWKHGFLKTGVIQWSSLVQETVVCSLYNVHSRHIIVLQSFKPVIYKPERQWILQLSIVIR